MKSAITMDEYARLPVYLHCCYHQKRKDGEYYLTHVNQHNVRSMVFEMAKNNSWANFFVWLDTNKIELTTKYESNTAST